MININDKHQNMTRSHERNHIVEIDDSKEDHIPKDFNEILSKINAEPQHVLR